jgi:toxin HigB-1
VIKSFRSADTERLFNRERVKKFQAIEHVALRRLKMLDATWQLRDLSAVARIIAHLFRMARRGRF